MKLLNLPFSKHYLRRTLSNTFLDGTSNGRLRKTDFINFSRSIEDALIITSKRHSAITSFNSKNFTINNNNNNELIDDNTRNSIRSTFNECELHLG